jgi:uncharacterized protein with GYD domain
MPKYLITGSYSAEGMRGVLKDGGSGRMEAVEHLLKGIGGSMESFYFAFGDDDVYVVVEAPDNVTTAAVSMAVGASGAVGIKTTVLLTPDEIDRAAKKTVDYRPPGK